MNVGVCVCMYIFCVYAIPYGHLSHTQKIPSPRAAKRNQSPYFLSGFDGVMRLRYKAIEVRSLTSASYFEGKSAAEDIKR